MDNKQVKILVATGIYPPDIGGPASIIAPLADSLRVRNFAVKVITYSAVPPIKLEKDVVRVVKNRFWSRLEYFCQLFKLSLKADLVYATDIYSAGYFAYLVKKFTGKKYVIRFAGDSAWETATANGWTSDYIVDFEKKKYSRQIEKIKNRRRKILVGADRVIAVSKFMGALAENIGVAREKIRVIYNAVDFIAWSAGDQAKKIRAEYPGKKIIVTACRLTKWKGVDGLILAVAAIKKEINNVLLLILGDGPEKENLQNLAQQEGVGGEVCFLGRISYSAALDYYRAADVFVLNSNYEGLSHTLLEAMTAGVPIVTTNVGGNPETIEDGRSGLLVEYGNQEQLRAAIVKILQNDRLAKELAGNAHHKLKAFSWEQTVGQTAEVFKELL